MLKRLLTIALLGFAWASAQAAEPAGKLTAEAIIKHTLETRLGGAKVDAVTKTPYLGLYEVRAGSEILYTDAKVGYIFSGNIIDARSMQNLTEKRLRELSRIKWEDLPLDAAFKTVHGKGSRTMAVFSDPNCPYCKRLEKELSKVDDVTVYTFLYPILSQDSHDKANAVWCSADRAKAWSDLMLDGKVPAAASCDTPIAKNLALGHKFRVGGTPTLVFVSGERVSGTVPSARLEKLLDDHGKK